MLILLTLASAALQSAQSDTGRTVTANAAVAMHATRPPVIDGRDNDPVWGESPSITEFTQWQPSEGKKPTFKTEAKVAYDASDLYVFVRAFDPHPDSILSVLERRDTY